MGLTQSSYPGINYCGVVEEWRQSANPDCLTLLFVFGNAPNDFTPEMACKVLAKTYGDDAFDGMRVLCKLEEFPKRVANPETPSSYTIVVEAHFPRVTDRQKLLSCSLGSSSAKDEKVFDKLRYLAKGITMRIMPFLPSTPSLLVFTIDNLPLGSYWEKCDVVQRRVIDMLFQNRKNPEATKDDIKAKHFVDITPGKADDKFFNGSVTIILKDVSDLDPKKLQFEEYGKTLRVSKHGTHFLYCSTCRRLDSHSQDESPFLRRKKVQYE